MAMQRNWIIEHEDDLQIGGNAELALIISRLPGRQIPSATSPLRSTAAGPSYAWIDAGKFTILDKGGTGRPLLCIPIELDRLSTNTH